MMPGTRHLYLWMLAEPLQVQRDVIEQIIGVLVDQLLQGGVAAGLTDVYHGVQRGLAHQQRLLAGFLQHRVQ